MEEEKNEYFSFLNTVHHEHRIYAGRLMGGGGGANRVIALAQKRARQNRHHHITNTMTHYVILLS